MYKALIIVILLGLAIWAGLWLGDRSANQCCVEAIGERDQDGSIKVVKYVDLLDGTEFSGTRDDTLAALPVRSFIEYETTGDVGATYVEIVGPEYMDISVNATGALYSVQEDAQAGIMALAVDPAGDYAPLQVGVDGVLKVRVIPESDWGFENSLPVRVVP